MVDKKPSEADDVNALADEELEEAVAEELTLEESAAKADEYLQDLLRLKAEFENYRKRMVREQTEAISRASSGLISNLLEVMDDFELALVATEAISGEHEAVAKGIERVYAKLYDTLKKEGLERIDDQGVTFDASIHEAVAHDDAGSTDGDLVVDEVFRSGYRIGPKVIRPAMVRVKRFDPAGGDPAGGQG